MSRLLSLCLALLLTGTALLAQAKAPVSSFVPAKDISKASVVEMINYYRALHGLAPLKEDSRLDEAADDRIRDMEEMEYYGHQGPDGRSPFAWLRPHGYDFAAAGENLAQGFETAPILVQSWMESPGHRANILSDAFENVGIAIIEGAPTGRKSGKTVVAIFAKSR